MRHTLTPEDRAKHRKRPNYRKKPTARTPRTPEQVAAAAEAVRVREEYLHAFFLATHPHIHAEDVLVFVPPD
jgi:hypothetical protein